MNASIFTIILERPGCNKWSCRKETLNKIEKTEMKFYYNSAVSHFFEKNYLPSSTSDQFRPQEHWKHYLNREDGSKQWWKVLDIAYVSNYIQ